MNVDVAKSERERRGWGAVSRTWQEAEDWEQVSVFRDVADRGIRCHSSPIQPAVT